MKGRGRRLRRGGEERGERERARKVADGKEGGFPHLINPTMTTGLT